MSYTQKDRKVDFETAVNKALEKKDGDELVKLAYMLSEEDAEPLLATARAWNKEDDDDWAYDRHVDNSM